MHVHRQFQPPWERREGATHASRLEFCLVFSLIVFQATPAENVWPLHSKSARSQVSEALFYVWTVTFVRAWICTDDTRAFRLQLKGRRWYLSQNIGPAVTGSAKPAPPPLYSYATCTILCLQLCRQGLPSTCFDYKHHRLLQKEFFTNEEPF